MSTPSSTVIRECPECRRAVSLGEMDGSVSPSHPSRAWMEHIDIECLKGSGGGAVAVAVQDAEEFLEGTDCVCVLDGEDAGELMQVGEVVNGPGRE